MLYKTVFTDRRLIAMRQSNGIRRQLTSEQLQNLGVHFDASEIEDWRERLKDTIRFNHGDEREE